MRRRNRRPLVAMRLGVAYATAQPISRSSGRRRNSGHEGCPSGGWIPPLSPQRQRFWINRHLGRFSLSFCLGAEAAVAEWP